jgi:four helix bundle protein
MSTQSELLKARTFSFSLAILRLVDQLPLTTSGVVIARQLARSATSVGANYRSSCIARSRAEFIAKLGVVVEESDESLYWLELISAGVFLPPADVSGLIGEARELRAIFGKSLGTARLNMRISK